MLLQVRTHGNWIVWIHFFLIGVAAISRDVIQQAGRLMDIRETCSVCLSVQPKAVALLDQLFVNPFITVAAAARILDVSNPTARQTVSLFLQNDVLEETTGRMWAGVCGASDSSERQESRRSTVMNGNSGRPDRNFLINLPVSLCNERTKGRSARTASTCIAIDTKCSPMEPDMGQIFWSRSGDERFLFGRSLHIGSCWLKPLCAVIPKATIQHVNSIAHLRLINV